MYVLPKPSTSEEGRRYDGPVECGLRARFGCGGPLKIRHASGLAALSFGWFRRKFPLELFGRSFCSRHRLGCAALQGRGKSVRHRSHSITRGKNRKGNHGSIRTMCAEFGLVVLCASIPGTVERACSRREIDYRYPLLSPNNLWHLETDAVKLPLIKETACHQRGALQLSPNSERTLSFPSAFRFPPSAVLSLSLLMQ